MIKVQLEEFDCPHGHGWLWSAQKDSGEVILRGEYPTMEEARSFALNFFNFLDMDFVFRRIKKKKGNS